MEARTYDVGRSRITLRFGDLAASKAEILVSSDDYLLSMGGGVSAALRRAGGSRLGADASKLVPAALGDVLVTGAGDLGAKYILHAVTIGAEESPLDRAIVVRQATRRAMDLLPLLGCTSIAFPAIGAGMAGIPYPTVAAEMAATLVSALVEAPRALQVELALMDRFRTMGPEDFFVFFEQFAAHKLGLASRPGGSGSTLEAPSPTATLDDAQRAQAQRRHEIYTMLRHLDARRSALERELVEALAPLGASLDTAHLQAIKAQLVQLADLRRGYEAELEPASTRNAPPVRDSVFVSSTSADLKAHRAAVRGAIDRLQLRYVGMEDFVPEATPPADLIRRKVDESEVYLGILALRYGHVDPGTGLSMTELEYRQALARGKPMHMFVIDDRAPITAGMVETDSVRFARLQEFKARVMKDHTCASFTDAQDLAAKAEAALRPASA